MNIGKRIKELRKAKGLTGIDLGKKANVGQSTISEIESGKRSPTLETIEKICLALDVRLIDLLDETMIEPDLLQLLDVAKKLTPEERQKVTDMIRTFTEERKKTQ